MPKKLIFHLGYHKTGSSSIQDWLLEHRDKLADHLYCYNLADGSSNPLKLAVHGYVMGKTDTSPIRAECRRMRAQIATLPQKVVCYSDEGLLGPPLGFRHGDFLERRLYPKAREIVAILAREFADFSPVFFAIERAPEAWLRSIYNQMARQECFTGTLEDFQREFGNPACWHRLREEIRQGIAGQGEFISASFETEIASKTIRGMTLFRILEIPSHILADCRQTLRHVNRSVPLGAGRPVITDRKISGTDTPLPPGVIALAYMLLLGRHASAAEIEHYQRRIADIPTLRHVLLNSPEFRTLWKRDYD